MDDHNMHHGQDHDMPPMTMNGGSMTHNHSMLTHMSFFWGKNSEILFNGWPGTSTGMYVLALVFVFVLAFIVEWLSYYPSTKLGSSHRVSAGLIRTLVHGLRVGLGYLVMLAVMSFNVGVFLVAVAGHVLGFFCFGRSRGSDTELRGKSSDLPPMSC